ncbi:mannitol dehydrogenase family protein [Kineococcus xinjiangensis]|uniref:mannitol dehydrogenase family protein n=1 Tax=Kineococcus xinjiangensis TaxID=512762 RepID=UPI001FEB6C3B|nr:mannitol dehydrogenase family protein [Kineococcus xinjiangensis]
MNVEPVNAGAGGAGLSNSALHGLPAAVAVPRYDRDGLVPAIVHIGVGGFHRAHQQVYFDELCRRTGTPGWGVIGVGLHRPLMGQVLRAQDGLYTVVVRSAEGDEVRVVGSLVDYLFAPDDPEAVLGVLADERTRIVTLTITDTAYPDGEVDVGLDEVRADVEHPEAPGTAFGYLVEALARRRGAGLPPLTVLSCDNVPHNGGATRAAVVSTARLRDPELADWIDQRVSFPSCMVDRITPETTPELREEVAARLGVRDAWPVVTEPFSQWIIEDDFCNGRPPLELAGAQFVEDVAPYSLLKTRLLNGVHSALGHLARLSGFGTAPEALADPVLRDYAVGYLHEVAALLQAPPGVDLAAYCDATIERLSNHRLADRIPRLCRRGSTKIPAYVLPSLRSALRRDAPRAHLVLATAAWMRALRGTDHRGRPFELDDADGLRLQPVARAAGTDPRPLLDRRDVFGSLGDDPRAVRELRGALEALDRDPLAAAVLARSGARGWAA